MLLIILLVSFCFDDSGSRPTVAVVAEALPLPQAATLSRTLPAPLLQMNQIEYHQGSRQKAREQRFPR